MARPKKENAIDIKGRAIDETLTLLREAPQSLSLSALAKRIGCSAPALYAHFKGKDELLEHARERAFREFSEDDALRFDAGPADAPQGSPGTATTPPQRIGATGQAILRYAREQPALYRLIFAPGHDDIHARLDIADLAMRPLAAAIRAAIPQIEQDGRADPDALAQMLWFSLHGAVMMALDRQMPGPDAARWARAAAILDTGLALLPGADAQPVPETGPGPRALDPPSGSAVSGSTDTSRGTGTGG